MMLLETLAEGGDPGTPLWLGISSFVVAFVAVVVSAIGTMATVRDLRRAAPSVKVDAFFTDSLGGYAKGETITAVLITLANRGREPTQVNHFRISSKEPMVWINGGYNLLDGPTLPHRLDGHTEATWTVDGTAFDPAPDEVHLVVSLGHGVTHEETIRRNDWQRGPYKWPRQRRQR